MEINNQIIYGRKPVIDALKKSSDVDKILVIQTLRGEFEVELRNLAKSKGVQLQRVPQEKLNHLSRNHSHQGVLAYLTPIKYHILSEALPKILEEKKNPLFLILDGIEDVRNFGAISRSALAFDADLIVTLKKGNARVNDVAIKTSAGALMQIPVCKEESLSDSLNLLAENGVKVLASSLNTENHLSDIDCSGAIALVLGSEERGISRITEDYADHLFKINQSPKMESLNVSVAAGIVLHHVYLKRL